MGKSTLPSNSTERAPLNVIIVGAGIAGLAFAKALECAPSSMQYTILEAQDELARQQGAGIALAPGGSRILDQLGIYQDLEEQLVPVSSSGLHHERGEMLLPARSDTALLVGSRMGYPFGVVERRNVIVALLNHVRRRDCIKTGKRVAVIEHSREQTKPITVVCTDGSRYQGDLVVGADGVRSKVRSDMWAAVEKGICGNFDVQRERRAMTAEYRCLFGISSPIPGYEPGCSDDTIATDVSTMVATTKGGRIFWFLFGRLPRVYRHDEIPRFGEKEAAEFAEQQSKLHIKPGITFGDLWSRREKVTLVALEEADFAHWTAGRFVVIGDGAHKMTPQTGSGGMLAVEHAAALSNLLHNLVSARLNKSPITTQEIETTLGQFDNRRRHLRTTAKIKETGAIARFQSLQSFTDRMVVRFLIRHAGDARADQLCGDAIGAERIDYLPLPKRSFTGSMPFNPNHGVGLHEHAWRRALWAFPLLLIGVGGFLSMFSVVPLEGAAHILDSGVYRWSADGISHEVRIPEQFYHIAMLDGFSRSGGMRFVVSHAHFFFQNFSLFADYGIFYAIMLVESARRSLRLTLLQCAILWGLINMKGIAIFVPVYYFAHYIASSMSLFDAPDMRLTDICYTKTILPILLVTHYATFITAYLAPTAEYRQAAAFLWELFPLWICLLQGALARYVFPSTILRDRLSNVTRDLPAIRRTMIPLCVFSAAVWQYTLWFSGSSPMDVFVPVVQGVQNLTFEQLFAETLKWDQVFFALANVFWIALLFSDMRAAGYIREGWLKLGFYAVALTAIGGNGTMLGVAWLYREEMLATRRHWAAVLEEPNAMEKA